MAEPSRIMDAGEAEKSFIVGVTGVDWAVGVVGDPDEPPEHAIMKASEKKEIPVMMIRSKQPPPETARPIFLCRPLLVRGTPIERETRDFAAERPERRFQEKPPLFTTSPLDYELLIVFFSRTANVP